MCVEKLLNSDEIKVGLRMDWFAHICIEFIYISIFDINEVYFICWAVELELKVDEVQFKYRF